jgi:hypothetical protein
MNELVDAYIDAIKRSTEKAKEILIKIDNEILRLYDLPARLEGQLLDLFSGHQRHVPFDFKGYEYREASILKKAQSLPEANITPQVSEFYCKKGISEYLNTALNIIKESFPPVRELHLIKEQDPETEKQWLLIDITIDGTIEEILDGYDNYVDQWVESTPESVREYVRLSYGVL